jgi:diadenosine tetraphosphate (Ap4A) HIT family hydrolase
MVLGFDVPHAHVHVVPLQKASDIMPGTGEAAPKQPFSEELAEMASRIAAALNG